MSDIALLQEQFVRKALEFEYCFNMSRYLVSPLLRLESSLLIDQRKHAYTLRELYFYEIVSVPSIGKDNPHSPSGRARNTAVADGPRSATTNDNDNNTTTISPKSSKSPVSGVRPDGSVQQQRPVAIQLHKLMSRSLRGADVCTTSESAPGGVQEEIEPELNDFATELLKQYAYETGSVVSNANDSISGGARVLESCSGFGEITKAYASSPTDNLHRRSVLIMCLIEVNSFPCVFFCIILYFFMDIY
jgi:hypothetical protein